MSHRPIKQKQLRKAVRLRKAQQPCSIPFGGVVRDKGVFNFYAQTPAAQKLGFMEIVRKGLTMNG